MRGSFLLVFMPLGAAFVTYLLHRWKLALWAAGAATASMAWMLLRLTPNKALPPGVDGSLAYPLGALFALVAFYFVIGALSPASTYIAIWGLISLSFLTASLQLGPGAPGCLFLSLAFIVLLPALYGEKSPDTSGSMGLIIISLLPLFSVTVLKPGFLLPAGFNFLPLSLLILLGFVPLHIWAVALFRGGSSFGAGFILGILRAGVILWLGRSWETTALTGEPIRLLQTLSLVSLAWAGLRGFASRNFQELAGYASVADGGLLLGLALSPGHTDVAFRYILTTTPGFIVFLSGIAFLDDARLRERGYPVATLLLLAGVFSIAGLPLTPGFAARIMAIGSLNGKLFEVAILLTELGLLLGGMRLLRPYSRALRMDDEMRTLSKTSLLAVVALVFGWLGLHGI